MVRGGEEVEGSDLEGIQSFVPMPGLVAGDNRFELRSCEELTPWRFAIPERVSPLRTV